MDGSIGELKISSLGIWDALYNKVINTDDVTFVKPKLRVVLAKPKDEKTSNNSKQPILFKNIHVQNGDIDILKFNKDSLVTVKNLNLELTNFRMTEKDVKQNFLSFLTPTLFPERISSTVTKISMTIKQKELLLKMVR